MEDPVSPSLIPSQGVLRALGVLSILEMFSLTGLFVNLFTVRVRSVSAILGPTHGALYVTVVVVALLARGLLVRTRLMTLIPLLGAVLTLVNVRAERRRYTVP